MKFDLKYFVAGLIMFLPIMQSAKATNDSVDTKNINYSVITYDITEIKPHSASFKEGQTITLDEFFTEQKKTTKKSTDDEIRIIKTSFDKNGTSHHRAKQYHKGIEVDKVQLLFHEKSGKVFQAHGNLVHGIELDTSTRITRSQAYKFALKHLEPGAVLWNKASAKHINKGSNQSLSNGKLIITSRRKSQEPENLILVYRFDIVTMKPLGRFFIDIDAQTGELINLSDQMYEGDVLSYGQSLYYDTVPITISDEDFPEWRDSTRWHPDSWKAFGNSGLSWWVGDPVLGTNGGYADHWYDVLETPPIVLSGNNLQLSFYHRYNVEEPETYEEYDGWDGMNVRISTDSGVTWQVLGNPSVPYTCSSLFSFGDEHGEGPDIPGWAGKLDPWTRVVFDISEYKDDTVIIRFAFASDPAFSTFDGDPDLFGWQIDNIRISNSAESLLFDDGITTQMVSKNIVQDARFIEGNYRLREIGRGGGISTYNAFDIESYSAAVDFVSDESVFTQTDNRAGVMAHWAQEATYDYFLNNHGRRSYDDEDGRLIAYVNWTIGDDVNNAVWVGFASLYGAGDGNNYGSFSDIDIVGHEITHGVTEYSAGLLYENQPGALNESFSDIFGIAIEIEKLGLDEDTWLIGENVTISGSYLRSMSDPNSRLDPDTYKGKYWRKSVIDPSSDNDWGGVHTNSGVQNYWFYLLSAGGSGTNDHGNSYSLAGIGVEEAAQIAYRNLTVYLQPTSSYHDAAAYSAQAAIDLFGEGSFQYQSVVDAWYAAGVYFTPKIFAPEMVQFIPDPGESVNRSITIRNLGMKNLAIDDIQIAGSQFQLNSGPGLPVNIAPETSISLNITFTSQTGNEETGLVTLYSNDPFNPVKEISLVGNPVNPNQVSPLADTESGYVLYQNFPNPFLSETTIQYSLSDESSVLLKVYNLSGQEIKTLVHQKQPEGLYSISWDGTSNSGNRINAGIYIYTIQTDEFISSKRLIVQ